MLYGQRNNVANNWKFGMYLVESQVAVVSKGEKIMIHSETIMHKYKEWACACESCVKVKESPIHQHHTRSMSIKIIHITSGKIIQLNEWGCRDGMHHANNHGNKEIPLAILSRILTQS